jgi:hypothetical protein
MVLYVLTSNDTMLRTTPTYDIRRVPESKHHGMHAARRSERGHYSKEWRRMPTIRLRFGREFHAIPTGRVRLNSCYSTDSDGGIENLACRISFSIGIE